LDLGHFDAARGAKVTKVGVLRGADAPDSATTVSGSARGPNPIRDECGI
jgi:hypothetical protein